MRPFAYLLFALSLPALCGAAPAIGVFTIVEGEAVVIRDSVRFPATEGLGLQADDIVHTSANARLVRMEFAEGGALDLGPATRVLLRPHFAQPRTERPAHLYLSKGWVKLTAGPAGKIGLTSPRVDLTDVAGAAVVRVSEEATFLFMESGDAKLAEHLGGQPAHTRRMTEGEAYERRGAEMGAVISRAAPDILKAMPRAFADTLPMRVRRFRDMQLAPASPLDITYDDVSGWINAESSLRPAFVQRWTAKARDPRFRAALVANLRTHPEWGRVLFPEKVAAKPHPATALAAAKPASAPAAKPSTAPAAPRASDPVPVTVTLTAQERERDVPWPYRSQ